MKLLFKTALTLSVIFLLNPSWVSADYDQAYKDYSYQFEQYRTIHQDYAIFKNKYLSYKSPLALAEALDHGKKVVVQRDTVLITYFQSLKEKLYQTPDVSPDEFVNKSSNIDTKIDFLKSNRDKVQSAINLTDLVTVSREVENIQNDLNALSKQTVGAVIIAKNITLRNSVNNSQDYLANLVSQNAQSLPNQTNLNRWLLESKNKLILSDEKIDQAKTQFNSIEGGYGQQISENFNKGLSMVLSSNQYLKEALSFQKEVGRGITND